MSNIKIITDSASDITLEEARQHDIDVLALSVFIDGIEYRTGIDITSKEFYEKLKHCKETPTTSQVPPDEIYKVFKKYVDEGRPILYISISAKGSGMYNSANIAKNMILEENPDAVIEVFDSKRFSYIYAYAAIEAVKLAEKGATMEEIKEEITRLMDSYEVYLLAESLVYLERGGRINKASLVIGNLLDIRPLLSIRDGLIGSIGKVRGSKKIMQKLFKEVKGTGFDQSGQTVIIINGDMDEDAAAFAKLLKEELSVKEVIIRDVCPTVGAHIGPVLALFFRKTV